ncbi:MAG TPA: phosphoribosylaminoimidazolesuccinocarboxamide synthase [Candidatus Nanopelagicaceae bacterium]|nr:phosphoribosylaminoimidazolesuccinocarboxamide synthase [Candidatus Nanopelagicaceae bacterium]
MTGFGPAGPPRAPMIDGWEHLRTGKVRDLYQDSAGRLLMVASDRISAFDWVLPTVIPDKGKVLTAMTLWWFEQIADIVPNHILSLEVPNQVSGRGVICRALDMFPVECVARGYLTGSGLVEYRDSSSVCGIALPEGLVDGSRLPEPIFTPATKAEVGEHDENVSFDAVVQQVGETDAVELRRLTLAVYELADQISQKAGIILADTKFEFGRAEGQIFIGDEVLTPDSSRFWPFETWLPGGAQPSFDKQFLRDWLSSSGWNKNGVEPPPELPDEIVDKTRDRYLLAYERLTGLTFKG